MSSRSLVDLEREFIQTALVGGVHIQIRRQEIYRFDTFV